MTVILKVEDIAHNYSGLKVLDGVSFSMDSTEKIALIGPNGAGKTTLLNVITGLLYPSKGHIYLLGQDITNSPTRHRISLGMGRSFQKNALFLEVTLLENVMLALRNVEASSFQMLRPMMSYKKRIAKAQELLESVDLWGKRDFPITSLSHGEQRQVEIILALASQPKILLLDEPSAGLTRGESNKLSQTLRQLMKDTAVLFVAHDLDLVRELSDRILVLYYGSILAEGTPEEIQNNQRVHEVYLGTETKVA